MKTSFFNPFIKDLTINATKSYLFGTFVGLIADKKENIHNTGKKFMLLSVYYTTSYNLLRYVRKKDDYYNKLGASVISGSCLLGRRGLKDGILGGMGFGLYTALNK